MSNQIVITSGAKVRELNDVIIGTSGVLSSLAFNVANGVPKLDSNAKILVSQLPNSVMEYQGTWNAATNTPTLTNGGAFNQGDVYLCNVAGTTNFGAGPISFIVGDSAIYSGSIWQRSGGATGSVTSVGLSTDGNAITIGNSPITTSGTITANFAGTSGQYINGAGNLTTFPTLLSSVGLSMPSAFSVSNSPLTANGTIAVTGAGYPSQYIRGDGTLADFPTSGGGGSSVSYYLNGGTSQGTIGGVTYYEMSKTADTGTGVDFPKSGDGLIVSFLTDAGDPAQLNIPAGNWNYEIYASMSSNGGTPQMYAELYVYNGTTFTLISTSSNEILYDGTNLNLYTFAMTVPATTLALTDRLAIKLYATNSGGKTTTVHTQDSHLCQVITTFSTGITALNGLTAQVQYFATGTSGTDFNISSTTATHTFNIPDASASARGLITTNSQILAGAKTFNSGIKAESGIFLKELSSSGRLAGYVGISTTATGGMQQLQFLYPVSGSSIFSLPTVGSYNYEFPTASGTIALTSNLSSYVPYTGAIADVNLGANFLKARTFYAEGNGGGGSYAIKNGATPSFEDGYTILSSNDYRLNILSTVSTVTKAVYLGFSGVTATRTYTLPDASGTIALTSDLGSYVTLATTQTITAQKSFSNLLIAEKGVILATGSTTFVAGSTTLNGNANGLTIGLGVTISGTTTNYAHQLLFPQLIPYTYTFPAATGTLALTSNLSSYVPYTGATADVDLGNNSLYLNNSEYIFGRNVGNTTAYNIFGINSSNKVQIDASGLGTIFGGAATIFGLLTGTTAAFSDSGTATNTNLISLLQPNLTASSGPILTLGKAIAINNAASIQFYYTSSGSSSNSLLLALYGSTGLTIYGNGNGSIAGSFGIGTNSPSYTLDVSGTGRFTSTLLVSGAATFSSNIAIAGQTLSAWGGTFGVMQSYYGSYFGGTSGGGTVMGNNNYYDGTNYKYINSDFAGQIQIGGGNILLRVAASGSAAGTVTFTNALTIASTGAATFSSNLVAINGNGLTEFKINNNTSEWELYMPSGGTDLRLYRGSDKVTFLANGNVGIGTTSPNVQLDLYKSGADSIIHAIRNTFAGAYYGGTGGSAVFEINRNPTTGTSDDTSRAHAAIRLNSSNLDGNIVFYTTATNNTEGTERMRITSVGDLYIGSSTITTSNVSLYWEKGNGILTQVFPYSSGTKTIQEYYRQSGASIGSISYNGTITSYNSTSDYRLKEDLKDYNGLEIVSKLKTYDFKWKDANVRDYGMMAHELQEVLPSYVNGEKDGEKMQGVDYSKLTPILVKAIQEMNTKLDEQNQTIQNLQEQINILAK